MIHREWCLGISWLQKRVLSLIFATLKSDLFHLPSPLTSPLSVSFDDPDFFKSLEKDYHLPVLPREVVHLLKVGAESLVLDGTLGGGGHSFLMLSQGAQVFAMDQDQEALDYANQRLSEFGNSFQSFHTNFADFEEHLPSELKGNLDAILIDIGVSSHQIDEAERGFSFQKDGPLDMRMGLLWDETAADVVNHREEADLANIFYHYGEEKQSRRIARGIVERRQQQPFSRTLELANFIESMIPRRGKTHPATQCFQALRIEVNQELQVLQTFLDKAIDWLKIGGRLGVITFHSLEDRLVKRHFQKLSMEWLDRPEWPAPRPNPEFRLKLINKKPAEAQEDELKLNPRARSAKFRVIERVN